MNIWGETWRSDLWNPWVEDSEYGGADGVPCSQDFWTVPLGPGFRRDPVVLRALPYIEYLESPEWQETRRKELTASDHRCYVCRTHDNLHVHHLNYDRIGEERPEDLQVLCASCHRAAHGIAV